MDIHQATSAYESWLREELPLVVTADLDYKHEQMSAAVFPFLRATFYRWSHRWPERCPHLADAPTVLGVGDLHVENYGTWRDAEGRLLWGVNDLDEACELPYTADLVRLATSAALATEDAHLSIRRMEAAEAILAGYRDGLAAGGRPLVLADHHARLRQMATAEPRDPVRFWAKLSALPVAPLELRLPEAIAILERALPEAGLVFEPRSRRAGLGSLGRPRLVAVTSWHGGRVAREAKALLPSAWAQAERGWASASAPIRYDELLAKAVRSADPFVSVAAGSTTWVVRRLAPDCTRIELAELPVERDEAYLLRSMGWELANIHLGTPGAAGAVLADMGRRKQGWLAGAATVMADDVRADWETWRK